MQMVIYSLSLCVKSTYLETKQKNSITNRYEIKSAPCLFFHQAGNRQQCELRWRNEDQKSTCTIFFYLGTPQMDLQSMSMASGLKNKANIANREKKKKNLGKLWQPMKQMPPFRYQILKWTHISKNLHTKII